MQNSRDSSVWRTLAIAFGDGLAFGVGVTLTRGAARLAANRAADPATQISPELQPRSTPLTPRVVAPPSAAATRPGPVSTAPIEAAIASISRRVTETSGQLDRRLDEMEA